MTGDLDELSYADLGRILNRSEGAVRVLYTRAIRRLRDECGDASKRSNPACLGGALDVHMHHRRADAAPLACSRLNAIRRTPSASRDRQVCPRSPSMSDAEKQLLQLLKARSFQLGDFRLASGDRSNYYIDARMTVVCSEGAHLIGEILFDYTKDLSVDAIGGLEVGAVPLTTAAVLSYHLHGRNMEGFWVRDEAKKHGTKKIIEGSLKERARVVIVDDVFTRGTSALKAIQAVRNIGCDVVMVLAIVDRLVGAEQLLRDNGVENYRSVFTIHDLGVPADTREPAQATARE
jgi:orotate phosphoribosyltransferase